jgi:hypothetical protein
MPKAQQQIGTEPAIEKTEKISVTFIGLCA